MSIYKYSNSTVSNASTASAFKAWLDDCKAAGNNFLSDLDITLTGSGSTAVVRITDSDGNYFEHFNISNESTAAQSGSEGYVTYQNSAFSISKHDNYYDGWHRVYIVGAILNDNGLFITAAFNYAAATAAPTIAANIAVGLFALVKDSNGNLSAILRNITLNNRAITESSTILCAASNSTTCTTLPVAATYSMGKTAILPVVMITSLNETTLPAFYTSLQTELPSLGLQAVSMEGNNYITNGYCFIKEE